uniref:Uncharacterized protein n=1 Tax=Glossina austeni TaxID=7395 RepID=A0A1A9V426_GLOAU
MGTAAKRQSERIMVSETMFNYRLIHAIVVFDIYIEDILIEKSTEIQHLNKKKTSIPRKKSNLNAFNTSSSYQRTVCVFSLRTALNYVYCVAVLLDVLSTYGIYMYLCVRYSFDLRGGGLPVSQLDNICVYMNT